MIFLILSMGFLNLGVGVVLAMQLGFGPPNLYALWESFGAMPEANEVGEGVDLDGGTDDYYAQAASDAECEAVPLPPEAAPALPVSAPVESALAEQPVDGDDDLANNPLLEQSVLDEVRALAQATA